MYNIVPKHRLKTGRIRHDIQVDRYWRHKVSRTRVRVCGHLLVDNVRQQILFQYPGQDLEFSLSLQEMKEQYEPDGNR